MRKIRIPPSPAAYRSLVFRAYLRRLAASKKPIVIGPYRSELGFEVLYFLPLLNWALKHAGIDPSRCIALSRGGMGVFYPAKHNLDLYQLRTVDEVRLENQVDYETRRLQKQTGITQWDRKVADDASMTAGFVRKAHLLHPSWMYWLFEGFWEERNTAQLIARHTDYAPLPVPSLPDGVTLPSKFVAVRFYERHTFPLQDQIKALTVEMVRSIASRWPVVLLNQHLMADDHVDLPIQGDNIFTLPSVPAHQNFILQAAVLARSQAFIGTYGGVAQWALRYGKPVVSFVSHFGGTAASHRNLSLQLSQRLNVPFEVCDLRALRLYEAALTRAVEAVPA